jgi:hypothetical protein
MAPPLDVDWLFLDTVIALAADMSERANTIKQASDDPAVLKEALYIESNALVIWKQARDYRSRLTTLKQLGNQDGAHEILMEVSRLAEEIIAATGHVKAKSLPVEGQALQKGDGAGKPSSLSV